MGGPGVCLGLGWGNAENSRVVGCLSGTGEAFQGWGPTLVPLVQQEVYSSDWTGACTLRSRVPPCSLALGGALWQSGLVVTVTAQRADFFCLLFH